MLKRRIIPKILIEERVVGGALEFASITTQRFSSVESLAILFRKQTFRVPVGRRVVCSNGTAANQAYRKVSELCCPLANESLLPLAVGGGIDSVDKANYLISVGADKVIVGRGAYGLYLLSSIASRFGSQSIVVSLDIVSRGTDGDVMTGAARSSGR